MHDTDADIASAPLPTANTLRARKSLFIQFGRFLAINTKMLKIIRKEHRCAGHRQCDTRMTTKTRRWFGR
jgi:hypothetical protein